MLAHPDWASLPLKLWNSVLRAAHAGQAAEAGRLGAVVQDAHLSRTNLPDAA